MIAATTNFQNGLASFAHGEFRLFIEIDGYGRAFSNFDLTGFDWDDSVAAASDWIDMEGVDPLTQTINDLDGGANVQSWGFTINDIGNAITADFASFVFEGKGVTLKVATPGLGKTDFCTVFSGRIVSVSSVNNNLAYYFQCEDTSTVLSKMIFTTADDNFETSSDHLRTVSGHPLDILLDILSVQCGLAESAFDRAKIEAYRDGIFSGMKFVFKLDQGVTALDFVKAQIMKPLGGYIWTNSAGKVTVNFFYPIAASTPVGTFSEDTWLTIPSAEQTDMVNTVQFQFDKDSDVNGTANYQALHTETYSPSTTLYGQFGEQIIAADGLRSGFQGYFIAVLVSRLIFMRYGFKNLKFDQDAAESNLTTMLYEVGDVVAVTHTKIPDRRAGVMGVTAKPFEILSKSFDLKMGRITYTMIDASYLSSFGFYRITPDAEGDYAGVSSGDKARYMFMTNDSGVYSNSDAGHGLG